MKTLKRRLEVNVRIRPVNRYFLVEPVVEEEKQEKTGILLPENYRQLSPYGNARVLACPDDCKLNVVPGDQIIYNNSTLETISINDKIFYLLLENYIQCVVEKE